MKNPKVLIAGGGIGGLALAGGLRRAGLDAQVYERAPALEVAGAGLSLWANAIHALKRLGLEPLPSTFFAPDSDGGIRTWRGEYLMPMSSKTLRERYLELSVVVHRADLQAALLELAGPDHVHTGRPITGFEEDDRGVTAHFADGSSARGDLLVGADGLRSVVRAQLHGAVDPVYAGYTSWRGVVALDHGRLTPGESWGRGARFGQVPLSGGRVYWFATHNEPQGARSPDGEKAALQRIFRGWHEPIEALIDVTPEEVIVRTDICDRPPLKQWGRGRVTLLGDAAHPMTPNLGQGGCQALEDAVVLVDALKGAEEIPDALRAYEARRIPRTTQIVARSRTMGQVGQWSNPLAVSMRDFLAKRVLPRLGDGQIEGLIGHRV